MLLNVIVINVSRHTSCHYHPHPTGMLSCYRPQRSCGQGYVFTRVCDSVNGGGGGGVLSQHALQVVSQHALQQVSGGACSGGSAPGGGCLLQRVGCLLLGGLLPGGCLLCGGVCSRVVWPSGMAFWFGGHLVESSLLLWPSGVIFCYGLLVRPSGLVAIWLKVVFCYGLLV